MGESDTSIARTEFDTALGIARHALEEFDRAPLVPSKRGGSRVSSWWPAFRQVSELAVKWHRELRALKPADIRWGDAELERLLEDGTVARSARL